MSFFDRIKESMGRKDVVEQANGDVLDETENILTPLRGQVRYVAYSKKGYIMYADGAIKRFFGIANNPQDSLKMIVRHRRSRTTKDIAVIPKSSLLPTNNPNRYWCMSHTSKGVEVQPKNSIYYVLIRYILEQDKNLGSLIQELSNLRNEVRRLGKPRGVAFKEDVGRTKDIIDAIAPVIKGQKKQTPEPAEPYQGGGYPG